MGAGSSVRTNATSPKSAKNDEVVDGATMEFDACANLLASKYHDHRLRDGGSSSGDVLLAPVNAVKSSLLKKPAELLRSQSSSPPISRAERKRLSRQLRRDTRGVSDDAAKQSNSEGVGLRVSSLAER